MWRCCESAILKQELALEKYEKTHKLKPIAEEDCPYCKYFSRGTNFQSANLIKANLSGADLSGADLSGADLSEANLSNTILDEVKVRRTRFRYNLVTAIGTRVFLIMPIGF